MDSSCFDFRTVSYPLCGQPLVEPTLANSSLTLKVQPKNHPFCSVEIEYRLELWAVEAVLTGMQWLVASISRKATENTAKEILVILGVTFE